MLCAGSEVATGPTLPSSLFPFPVLWEVGQMWILLAESGPCRGTGTIHSEEQEPPTALKSLRFVLFLTLGCRTHPSFPGLS